MFVVETLFNLSYIVSEGAFGIFKNKGISFWTFFPKRDKGKVLVLPWHVVTIATLSH